MNITCKLNTMYQCTAKLCNRGTLNIVEVENNFILWKTEFTLLQVIQNIYQNTVN